MTPEEYAHARAELDEYAERIQRAEREQARNTLHYAGVLAALFEDGRWVAERNADRAATAKTPKGGRPVEPGSRSQFASWVKERWTPLQPAHVYRLVDANALVRGYFSAEKEPPETEYQVRPLKRLQQYHGDAIPGVWDAAVALAGGGQPTREQVAQAVRDWQTANISRSQAVRESRRARAQRQAIRVRADFDALLNTGYYTIARDVLNAMHAELAEIAQRQRAS